jgi:hypothetical protein
MIILACVLTKSPSSARPSASVQSRGTPTLRIAVVCKSGASLPVAPAQLLQQEDSGQCRCTSWHAPGVDAVYETSSHIGSGRSRRRAAWLVCTMGATDERNHYATTPSASSACRRIKRISIHTHSGSDSGWLAVGCPRKALTPRSNGLSKRSA